MSAERLVTRAITTAKRSPSDAVRALFKGLFAGTDLSPLSPAQWEMLSALAERATVVKRAGPPVAAKPLGDDWFECPQCGDVFEGPRATCVCGAALGAGAAVLEIAFGDAMRMSIRPSRADELGYMGRLTYLATALEGLRVEHGARWFELVDDVTTMQTANTRAALPPNLVPIGVHHDGAIVLAHETKLEVFTVDAGGTVTRVPDRIACAAEIIVRQIEVVTKI